MTIKEIKTELAKEIEATRKINEKRPKDIGLANHCIGKEYAFKQALELLNQLSAPELVWKRNLLVFYAEALNIDEKRTLTYEIGADRDNFFVLINGELETLDPLKSEDEARKFAQTHWNKLYFQIINL